MAVLRSPSPDSAPVRLLARHSVGRRPGANNLVIADPLCSGQHAEFAWDGQNWSVRDLGSRNGTWVKGHRLEPSRRAILEVGARVAFGNPPEAWVVEDIGPPTAGAVGPDGTVRFAEDGLLALPDETDPEVTISQGADGVWMLEGPSDARDCRHISEVPIGEAVWRLVIPVPEDRTHRLDVIRPIDGAELHFRVTSDEENVVIDALFGGIAHQLEPRAHNYLLLTLARRRLADRAAGVAEEQAGWIHRDDLARMLRMGDKDLNVQIFRARKQIHHLGVDGAPRVVERRSPDGLIRIGIGALSVETVDPATGDGS